MATKEIQYNELLDDERINGKVVLGYTSGHTYRHDPKRLTFLLSRYKFVAKMFDGYDKVLEVGCGDGFGSTLVANSVGHLIATDFDPVFIENAKQLRIEASNIEFKIDDILQSTLSDKYNGIYSLDVLEHIDKSQEDIYMTNIQNKLTADGVVIIGMPSLESQEYASPQSKVGHINCKSGKEFKKLCSNYFHNVFLFSMNDEVVHTGFYNMAHYLLALCVYPKKS